MFFYFVFFILLTNADLISLGTYNNNGVEYFYANGVVTTWTEAERICSGEGYHLIVLPYDLRSFGEWLKGKAPAIWNFWVGLRQDNGQLNASDGWYWLSSEREVLVEDWLENEPNDFPTPAEDDEENFGMYGYDGWGLVDVPSAEVHSVFCSYNQSDQFPTPFRYIGYLEGRSYYAVDNFYQRSQEVAEDICESKGLEVAIFPSDLGVMKKALGNITGKFRTGLKQDSNATQLKEGWRWTRDSRPVLDTEWSATAPNDYNSIETHQQDCATFLTTDQSFYDDTCSFLNAGILCSNKPLVKVAEIENTTFYLVEIRFNNHDESKTFCEEQNLDFASLPYSITTAELLGLFTLQQPVRINFRRTNGTNQTGSWIWGNGRPYRVEDWAPGEPNESGEEYCGILTQDGVLDYSCSSRDPIYFMCSSCSDGYFGEMCDPCSCLRGSCNDGKYGNGTCNCPPNSKEPNCECLSGFHGDNCENEMGTSTTLLVSSENPTDPTTSQTIPTSSETPTSPETPQSTTMTLQSTLLIILSLLH